MLEILLLTLALLLWTATPAALAQQEPSTEGVTETAASYANGFALYQRYCRSCHGKTAHGDGNVAKYLKVEPADLTRLAADNAGDFPTERVLRSLDGRELSVPLHGRDMPIWGAVFQVDEGQTEADAQRKLGDLVEYLKGIQAEAPGETAVD